LVAGICNTIGLNDPDGTGDTCPQVILDSVDLDALAKEFGILSAFKNGPRLWFLVMTGQVRDLNGLNAQWVMWLDVPDEMRPGEGVAYRVTAQ